MVTRISCLILSTLVVVFITAPVSITGVYAQESPANPERRLETRLQELEAREQIRQLMHNYGRYLDERNFSAFAALFAESGSEYISGNQTARGGDAIGKMLEDIITANPSGFKSPNFHVFFNENIQVEGERATAFSQSAYIVPDDNGDPKMVFFATYDDIYVRERGVWKFQRRAVRGNLPAR